MNSTLGPERVQSLSLFGVVAQLAERLVCIEKDEGSSPFCSTIALNILVTARRLNWSIGELVSCHTVYVKCSDRNRDGPPKEW